MHGKFLTLLLTGFSGVDVEREGAFRALAILDHLYTSFLFKFSNEIWYVISVGNEH